MNTPLKITTIFILSLMVMFTTEVFAQKKKTPVRVLAITGGHGFDRAQFDAFKQSLPGITVDEHVLLATDEPTASPSLAWTHHYGKSKIVTILLGHDNQAWSNPNFVKLLTQAIMWVK